MNSLQSLEDIDLFSVVSFVATYKVVGSMARSADIMKALNNIVKVSDYFSILDDCNKSHDSYCFCSHSEVPELQMTMMTMAREMEKVC